MDGSMIRVRLRDDGGPRHSDQRVAAGDTFLPAPRLFSAGHGCSGPVPEALRNWEARFVPLIADCLRAKRRGQVGSSWYVDETEVCVKGRWWYLYTATDREGT